MSREYLALAGVVLVAIACAVVPDVYHRLFCPNCRAMRELRRAAAKPKRRV